MSKFARYLPNLSGNKPDNDACITFVETSNMRYYKYKIPYKSMSSSIVHVRLPSLSWKYDQQISSKQCSRKASNINLK